MKNYDQIRLEKKVHDFLAQNPPSQDLIEKITSLEKPHSVWRAYVETVKALGTIWKSFGINPYNITNIDYSLVHIQLFKNLMPGERRVILCKMEQLMKDRIFLRSNEALELYKEFV